jgi:ribonuclease HI
MLGTMSNNEVEAYALYEGIMLDQSMGIEKLTICGDSMMVIREIIQESIVGGNVYTSVMSRSLTLLKNVGTGADPGFNASTMHQQNPNYRPFRQHLRSR